MFELQDVDNIFTALGKDFTTFCRVLSVLSLQGELLRRYECQDIGSPLDEEFLQVATLPYEVVELKAAAINAIMAGLKRDVEEEKKERDLSLEKLKKKPGKAKK